MRRGFEGGRRFFQKPVKIGDEIEVKVEGHGKNGDGVAKIDGYVIFIKGDTEEGKSYKVKVETVGRKFATATLM